MKLMNPIHHLKSRSRIHWRPVQRERKLCGKTWAGITPLTTWSSSTLRGTNPLPKRSRGSSLHPLIDNRDLQVFLMFKSRAKLSLKLEEDWKRGEYRGCANTSQNKTWKSFLMSLKEDEIIEPHRPKSYKKPPSKAFWTTCNLLI